MTEIRNITRLFIYAGMAPAEYSWGGATWCEAPRRSTYSAEGAAAGVGGLGGRAPMWGV